MCGIAGGIGRCDPRRTEAVVRSMIQAQHHRGPDACGIVRPFGGCVLGSTRLAVLDLSDAAAMPMRDQVTGNVLVFNGEIYNHVELRRWLAAMGATFQTNGDTEVLLKAYAHLGPKVLDRLDGMFAFAMWDHREQELMLARDPIGEKPLYIAEGPDGILFASEVRALLASGQVQRRIDAVGLRSLVTGGFVVSPHTMIAGISSLLPGTSVFFDAAGRSARSVRYWSIPPVADGTLGHQPSDVLREPLLSSVRTRLGSDVPLAVFLSGGIDSALTASIAQSFGRQIATFSLTFPGTKVDEGGRIAELVNAKGFDNVRVELAVSDFFDLASKSLRVLDQPSLDGANTFIVSHYAKSAGFTVALSGLGADELFGGYPFFRQAMQLARLKRWLARTGTGELFVRIARAVSSPDSFRGLTKVQDLDLSQGHDLRVLNSYLITQRLFPEALVERILASPGSGPKSTNGLTGPFLQSLRADLAGQDEWGKLSAVAIRLFLGERALRDADGASMASSLELRTPFTAKALVEAAFQLPGSLRMSDAPRKPILSDIARSYLPADWLSRNTKKGFLLPFDEWLRTPAGTRLLDDTLLDRQAVESVGLAAGTVEKLVAQFKEGTADSSWSRIWPLLSLVQWADRNRVTFS